MVQLSGPFVDKSAPSVEGENFLLLQLEIKCIIGYVKLIADETAEEIKGVGPQTMCCHSWEGHRYCRFQVV